MTQDPPEEEYPAKPAATTTRPENAYLCTYDKIIYAEIYI